MEDDRLRHTLVLLLSRRDMPDTSRKPAEGKQTQFFAGVKPRLETWEPIFPSAIFLEYLTCPQPQIFSL